MSILITAMALAAAPATSAAQPVPSAAPATHAQHAQPPAKPQSEGCCCKKMAEGGKMACCAEHGKGQAGEHSEHGASR